jgi:outer membrane protein assembly factor BamB
MRLYLLLLVVLGTLGTVPAHADFSFVHITDTHFTEAEAVDSNAAKNRQLYQEISRLEPSPAFVVNTGDVCEIGTPAEYAVFLKAQADLKPPQYVAPGNHDVRWNPRGKEGYTQGARQPLYQSWDYENIHFVLLDSTVLLQHWGHFDKAQLAWLAKDLKAVGTSKPIVIGFHHWVGRDTVQVDNEIELLRTLAPYNVRLLLIGHGHTDMLWNVNGIPAVMAKGLYQGSYHLIKVTADRLEVRRRTTESGKPDVPVVSIPLNRPKRPKGSVTVSANGGLFTAGEGNVVVERGDFPLESTVSYRVDDGKPISLLVSLKGWEGPLDMTTVMPGFHYLNLTLATPTGDAYFVPIDFQVRGPSQLAPIWRTNIGSEVQSKLVHAGTIVYVPTMGGDMVALEAKTGKEKFRIKTGGAIFSVPLIVEGTLYFGSADHFIYAADATTGKVRWKTKTGGAVFAGASKAGKVLCIPSTDQKIYGLESTTGKVLWTVQGENMFQSQVATDGERFFIGGWDNQFRCVEASSGKELWRQPFGKHEKSGKYLFYYAPAIASPTVADGLVMVSSNDGILHALERATGKIVWEVPGPALGYSSPLAIGGRVFNASLTDEGKVFCFDGSNGSKIWERATGAVIYDSSCIYANGRIYVGSVNGTFSALGAGDGELLWQYRLPPGHLLASPATDGKTVFIGSLSGDVFAFPAL